jgi:hypothetical protein
MIKFSLFEINLDEKSKRNTKWSKDILTAISTQLEGYEQFHEDSSVKYNVTFKDFELLDLSDSNFIVPSNYYFNDDIYIDIKRKIAIRQKNDYEIEYWCESSYGLSIPFVFQLILVNNSQTFIHSGAFSYNNKGVVISAFGGIGKTALLSQIVDMDRFKVMGDDLNILSDSGTILSYPRPFCLYEYHNPLFKRFYKENKLKYLRPKLFWKIYNRMLRELYQRTGIKLKINKYTTYASSYVTASPFSIFKKVDIQLENISLGNAFVVGRHSKGDKVIITKISKEEFSDFSLNVLYHEWDYMDKSLKGYLTFKNIGLSTYFNDVKKTMQKSLINVETVYKIDIPISMKMQLSTETLFNEIKKIVSE